MSDNKKLFISYNSADREEVSDIYKLLKDQGFAPWMDRSDLDPGSRWRKELEKEIETSAAFLLLIGDNDLGRWQEKEWDYAVHLKESGHEPHKVLPVVLMSVTGKAPITGFLTGDHHIDLRDNPYQPLEKLLVALDDKPEPTRPAPHPAAPVDGETTPLECYLRRLWRDCLELKTTNFEYAVQQRSANLQLPSVYTPLDIIEPPVAASRAPEGDEPSHGEQAQRRAVMAAILQHPLLVLTGDPGSGKSTVVDYLTVCLTGQALDHPDINLQRLGIEDFPKLLPIRIILRHFAPHGLARDKDLWTYIREHTAKISIGDGQTADCAGELEARLKRKEACLLLLDGIDEVPDARGWRLRLKECVANFRARFPHCRILVTSRPYAYQDRGEQFTDFVERRIAPFTLEQMQGFVDHWYPELGRRQARLGPDDAVAYAKLLRDALEYNPRLQELGANPLLMSLMAWLHRLLEGKQLPERRQKLYELCVEHLIDIWQMDKPLYDEFGEPLGKQYDIQRELGIGKEALRTALQRLAFDAHHDQPAS